MRHFTREALRAAHALQKEIRDLGLLRPQGQEGLLTQFDRLVTDEALRTCARPLFADGHYAKAVEEAYICLDNVVSTKSRLPGTGKGLMFGAFHPADRPVLRINPLRDPTDQVEQEGFGHIAAGCMMACRNPRAHRHGVADEPQAALAMLVWANHLVTRVRAAKRPRKRQR